MICVLPGQLQDVLTSVWPGLRIRKYSSKQTKCCKNAGSCKNSNMLIYYIFLIFYLIIGVIWSVSNCWKPGCSIVQAVWRYLIWLTDIIIVGHFSLNTMFFHLSFHSTWWYFINLLDACEKVWPGQHDITPSCLNWNFCLLSCIFADPVVSFLYQGKLSVGTE